MMRMFPAQSEMQRRQLGEWCPRSKRFGNAVIVGTTIENRTGIGAVPANLLLL